MRLFASAIDALSHVLATIHLKDSSCVISNSQVLSCRIACSSLSASHRGSHVLDAQQCPNFHVRRTFGRVGRPAVALWRGFGRTVSRELYRIRKCPPSGPRAGGLGSGLDRPNNHPSATSTVDRSAIRNT